MAKVPAAAHELFGLPPTVTTFPDPIYTVAVGMLE